MSKHYLLIPAMPTPNGRLHLGHIGGPFLKMDILARHLRRMGNHAEVISTSDIYESYVLLKALQTKTSVREVCNKYFELMEKDLEALSIDCIYHNPLDEDKIEAIDQVYLDTIEKLEKSNATHRRNETIHYSPSSDKYISGVWIQGDCPSCSLPTGSYLCEACGMQYNPEDYNKFKSTTDESDLVPEEVNSLFLKVENNQSIIDEMSAMGTRPEFIEIAEKYLERYDGEVRLTNPGKWGVTYDDDSLKGENTHIIFPYSGLFSLSRYCGKLYQALYKLDLDPFHTDSEVITLASFGKDSTVPWFVGVQGSALSAKEFKPFNYFLTNHFLMLEGSKFSTSRLHVIWAGDIIEKTNAKSDAVRFFLSLIHPEDKMTDFKISEFIDFNNGFIIDQLLAFLNKTFARLGQAEAGEINADFKAHFEEALAQQRDLLEPPAQQLNAAGEALKAYISALHLNDSQKNSAYWELKTLSFLLFAFMPDLSKQIWASLGLEGDPIYNDQFYQQRSNPKPESTFTMEYVSYDSLEPCLPQTLTAQ